MMADWFNYRKAVGLFLGQGVGLSSISLHLEKGLGAKIIYSLKCKQSLMLL